MAVPVRGWSCTALSPPARWRAGLRTQGKRSKSLSDYVTDGPSGIRTVPSRPSNSSHENSIGRGHFRKRLTRLAGKELVGWIEEAHKGLEGLRRNDIGRLLNARFGLSWGLAWVMRLHRGVLSTSDNTFYDDVTSVVGTDSRWARLLRRAFGTATGEETCSLSLREEVESGLLLYCETFALLEKALPPDDYILIEATVQRIRSELEGQRIGCQSEPRKFTGS